MFFEADIAGPATHALVIGVGAYPYLTGGDDADDGLIPALSEVGQLTSAAVSARAFADWLVSGRPDRWTAPLSTVDLLINGPGAATFPTTAQQGDEPTINNIQGAFDRWLRRCEKNADNVAILYFCGHGVQSDQQILLASDFGQSSSAPFRGAFGFDTTRLGLMQRRPKTQCVIVDACRLVLPEVWERMSVDASPLLSASVTTPLVCEYDLTLRAAPFEAARAPSNRVAYLTSAVLQAFDGQAATQDEFGGWVVKTGKIAERIDEIMTHCVHPPKEQRISRGEGFASKVLYRLDKPPLARLRCSCHPLAAASRAAISCEPMQPPSGSTSIQREAVSRDPWQFDIEAGHYQVSARFADRSYADKSRSVLVEPPMTPVCVRVTI
jgi:hypothetical protein